MITPCAQTLQSFGIFTGSSHQELQCRLHNSDIKSKIIQLSYVLWMVFILWTAWFFLISVSLPFSFMFVFLVCSPCNDHLRLVWAEPNPDKDTPFLDRSWSFAWIFRGSVLVRCYGILRCIDYPFLYTYTCHQGFIWLFLDDCISHIYYLLCLITI